MVGSSISGAKYNHHHSALPVWGPHSLFWKGQGATASYWEKLACSLLLLSYALKGHSTGSFLWQKGALEESETSTSRCWCCPSQLTKGRWAGGWIVTRSSAQPDSHCGATLGTASWGWGSLQPCDFHSLANQVIPQCPGLFPVSQVAPQSSLEWRCSLLGFTPGWERPV